MGQNNGFGMGKHAAFVSMLRNPAASSRQEVISGYTRKESGTESQGNNDLLNQLNQLLASQHSPLD